MCTAITFNAYRHYFGRNLDLEKRYDESITITPRNYILKYKSCEIERRHFAFIGTATVVNNYPLYYDAINEKGLGIAGLNFVGNANYKEKVKEKDNINFNGIFNYLKVLFFCIYVKIILVINYGIKRSFSKQINRKGI